MVDARAQIGPYRILETLGEGGMGTVYLAEQREPVRRRVALKVIKLGMDSKAVLARFEVERRALSMMGHSCIATVLDAGLTEHGQPFFVMEYVKGIPITDYCDQNKLSLKERIELFQKVCSGVQHAHLKGVMHRDLKPGNVLVTLQDGRPLPKIIDFGLAKATDHHLVEQTLFTEQGVLIGTPEYMSPEQAGLGGLDVDTRTDVYSLGVLLYELLVGELPFSRQALRAAGMLEMQRVIREQEPTKPSTRITTLGELARQCAAARRLDARELQRKLRGDLDWIVLRALEKDRTRRYETTQELAADLQRHLQFEPVLACPPSIGYRVKKFVRRYRVQCAAAAVVCVAIVGGGIGTALGFAEAREQTRIAKLNEGRAKEQQKLATDRAMEIAGLLRGAQEEAVRNRIFADVASLAEARRLEEELYPAFPDKVPAMEAWLVGFGEPLVARLPALEQELSRLRGQATPTTDHERELARARHSRWPELQRLQAELAQENTTIRRDFLRESIASLENEIAVAGFEFASAPNAYLHRTLTRLVRDLGEFVQKQTVPRVRARVAEAKTLEQRSIDAHRRVWDEAIAAIRASDEVRAARLYDRFELATQPGLVPIGMDPGSKLWEFVHLASGAPGKETPRRDEATGRLEPTEGMGIVFVLLPGGDLSAPHPLSPGESRRVAPFFLSKYEMTQGQWLRLAGVNPSETRNQDYLTLPVENVNWFEAEEVLRHYGCVLPSHRQWQYACLGGTTTPWWTGADAESMHARENLGVARSELLPVASLAPNPFGLFDMLGNVEEWCLDGYDAGMREARLALGEAGAKMPDFRSFGGGSFRTKDAAPANNSYSSTTPLSRSPDRGLRAVWPLRP